MNHEIIEVVMPPELLADIRDGARTENITQQGFIRKAVMEYINKEKTHEQ